jgi:MOSC domain-containing protein YiiM
MTTVSLAPSVQHLFVSRGHNYFGHHEQPPGDHAIAEVDEIECVADRGLRGDRFFDHKPGYKGQITFFAMEVFDRLRAALNLPHAQPGATRRNVFTRHIDLNELIGTEFELQQVRFAGIEECRPCHWMNTALGPGAEVWLRGNGGLRARILTDGILRRDGIVA